MKKDGIKKRFMDILFESDDPTEEEVLFKSEENTTVKEEKPVIKESTTNAKDFLYNKNDQTFINYQAKPVVKKQEEEPYEFSSQISPMFGLISEPKKAKESIITSAKTAVIDGSKDSHLDIVTSPIYGYATGEKEVYKDALYFEETSEEEIHRIFEKEDPQTYRNPYETRTEELSLFDIFEEENK